MEQAINPQTNTYPNAFGNGINSVPWQYPPPPLSCQCGCQALLIKLLDISMQLIKMQDILRELEPYRQLVKGGQEK